MARLKASDEVKEVLLQKEMLLFEAKQSPMAYFMPSFLIIVGVLTLFPQFWDQLQNLVSVQTKTYIPMGKHVFSEMLFGMVFITGGISLIYQRNRQSRTGFHFVTNLRVVERNKTWRRDDLQFIMLHHIKFVRIKAGIMQRLTQTGRVIMEDDKALEHIEIPNVNMPKLFKEAITKAANRFGEMAERAESDGYLIQVQSEKSAREQRERKRKEALKKKRKEEERLREEKKKLEEAEAKKRLEEEEAKKRYQGEY